MLKIFDNCDHFRQSEHFLTILTILTIFTIFFTILTILIIFLQFWQLAKFFAIQTIAVAILTIEKTILETCDIWDTDNLCYLTINCDTGQHSQFLRCFFLWREKHVDTWTVVIGDHDIDDNHLDDGKR